MGNFLMDFVDFFRDRFRTAINVLGDSFVAGAISQTSADELAKLAPFDANKAAELEDDELKTVVTTNGAPKSTVL